MTWIRRPTPPSWPGVGIEVTADRQRTWVVRAAWLDGRVLIECLEPLPGTAVVPQILNYWNEWEVEQIGIDPRSPSSTLVELLEEAGVLLKLADAVGMAVAHGRFCDWLDTDRLRHRGHKAMSDAVRLAQKRRLAGSHALDRYADPAVAPAIAAELAAWSLDPDPEGSQPSCYVL